MGPGSQNPPVYCSDLEDDRTHKIIRDKKYIQLLKTDCNSKIWRCCPLRPKGCAQQVGSESVLSATFGSSPLFLLIWFYFIVEIKLAAKFEKETKQKNTELQHLRLAAIN